MQNENALYKIALTKIDHVGPALAKALLQYCGTPEAVFKESPRALRKIPQIGLRVLTALKDPELFRKAERELEFISRNGIAILFYKETSYPWRLLHQADAPILLYYKGTAALNADRVISIVGTRNMTEYGSMLLQEFIGQMEGQSILVISGLAYGVDSMAHSLCLRHHLPTVGVLGHGLDRIYPHSNRKLGQQMMENGGLLTEFGMKTQPDRENFPMRNRIVAGLCDALLVVETAESGGSMITAELANQYSKDVFAFPGRVQDPYSKGCHKLIKTHKAYLVEELKDVWAAMSWDLGPNKSKPLQSSLFVEMNEEEQTIFDLLHQNKELHIDRFHQNLKFSPSKLAHLLLHLEFKGIVRELPGKRYTLIK